MDRAIRLKEVSIVDTISGSVREPLDVIISEGKIQEVCETGTPPADDVLEIACSGKFAVPGFFDCHTHLATLTNQPPEVQREIFGECHMEETFRENTLHRHVLNDFVRRGVTQVRDLGGPVDTLHAMRQDISHGAMDGPDLFYAGPMLEMPPLSGAEMNDRWPGWMVAVESADRAREIIASLDTKGVACLKVFGKFQREVLESFVYHAERIGLPVTCDPGPPFFHDIDIPEGIGVGIMCFEHASALWYPVLQDNLKEEHDGLRTAGPDERGGFTRRLMHIGPESISIPKLNNLSGILADAQVVLCPTLNICKFFSEKPEVYSEHEPEKFAPIFATLYDVGCVVVRRLAKHGVRLLVGQDGYIPRFTHREMILLFENGLSTIEILRGATIYPAQWLGLADRYGSIETGKKANLVVLDADPVEDIRNTKTIDTVILGGRIMYRSG